MQSTAPENTKIFQTAWARTKDRWVNYILIVLEYIFLPVVIAFILTAAALVAFPFIATLSRDPNANVAVQIITGAAAIIIPVVAIVGAIYRYIVGTIALIKSIADKEKNRKKTIAESKKLVFPYFNLAIILTILNIGFIPYLPLTLLVIGFYIQIWSQFAMFSFVTDEQKGAYNIWKAVTLLKTNFWKVTGQAIVVHLFAALIANLGGILSIILGGDKNPDVSAATNSLRLLSTVASIGVQIFVIAYMYELYTRLRQPAAVKPPKVWIAFSVVGWLILIILVIFGIQFLATQLPQLLTPSRM